MGRYLQTVDISTPGQNLTAYIQAVCGISMLSAAEELALGKRLYFENDLDAARQLVLSHLRFVVHIAKSYSGYGLSQADLIQEGNIGLMKAVKRFDPRVGVRLVSFAIHWIKAEMHEFILKNWRIVKVATTKAQRKLFFNLRSAKKKLAWFSSEEISAVAEELGVKPETVREMEGRMTSQDKAFDGFYDEDDEAPHQPVHYLADHTGNPEILLEKTSRERNRLFNLQKALNMLDERSRDILQVRWLSEPKMTLHQLAARYEVSAERIRQLEKNAFKKLKALLSTSDSSAEPELPGFCN